MKKLVMILCLLGSNAFAMTGNELISRLQSKDASIVLQAHAYIAGVTDSEATFLVGQKFALAQSNGKKFSSSFFCIPEGVVTRKIVDTVSPKIEGEPQTRQQSANVLIRRALIETWPCPNNP